MLSLRFWGQKRVLRFQNFACNEAAPVFSFFSCGPTPYIRSGEEHAHGNCTTACVSRAAGRGGVGPLNTLLLQVQSA